MVTDSPPRPRTFPLRKAASAAVLCACVFFLVSYVRDHLSDFSNLSEISLHYVFLIGLAGFLVLAVNGLFLKALTIDFGIDLSFPEHFSISVLTSFGNVFLPMKGGAGFRAVYLKSKYDFDYSYFLSSLAGNYLVVFHVNSLAALAGMAIFFFRTGAFSYPVVCVFLAVAAASFWAIFFPPASIGWIPFRWPRERINQVLSGWNAIRRSGRTVRSLFALTLLNVFLCSAATWFEFAAFGARDASGNAVGFLQSVIFTMIGALSLFVSITPSALGIRESLLMFSSEFLGISPSQALAVALLDRSVNFFVLAVFFGFASMYIRKAMRRKVRTA